MRAVSGSSTTAARRTLELSLRIARALDDTYSGPGKSYANLYKAMGGGWVEEAERLTPRDN